MLQVTGYVISTELETYDEEWGAMWATDLYPQSRIGSREAAEWRKPSLPKSKYQITLPNPVFIRGEAAFNTIFLYWAYVAKLSKETKIGYTEGRRDMLKKSL